jgi:signal peptidase
MKKKKINTVLRVVLLTFISCMVGLKLYFWNAKTIVGNELAMPFGYGITVVLSGSMEPTLSVDDLAVIQESDTYAVGDVIVYQDSSSLVIHRIIAIDDTTVTTQGDANNAADPPVAFSEIKGKEIAAIPKLGIVVRFLKSSTGFLVVLVLAIALLEIPRYRERKQLTAEQEKIKAEIRRLKDKET